MTGRLGPETIETLRRILPRDDGSRPRTDLRPAAVLIPLYLADGDVHVVLTQRTNAVSTHQGQVSFPGGRWEEGDATLLDTALREAEEEVGLRPSDVEVLGVLEDVPTAVSGFIVRPFVGVVPHPYEFVHQAREVAFVFAPRLQIFADPARRRVEWRERDGRRYEVYFYEVDGAVVWGATARMLLCLVELVGTADV